MADDVEKEVGRGLSGVFKSDVRTADRYVDPASPRIDVEVRRVGKAGWVDVFCYDNPSRTSWTKRMPYGIPATWIRKSRRAGIVRNG